MLSIVCNIGFSSSCSALRNGKSRKHLELQGLPMGLGKLSSAHHQKHMSLAPNSTLPAALRQLAVSLQATKKISPVEHGPYHITQKSISIKQKETSKCRTYRSKRTGESHTEELPGTRIQSTKAGAQCVPYMHLCTSQCHQKPSHTKCS